MYGADIHRYILHQSQRTKKCCKEEISMRKDAKTKLEDFVEVVELPLDVEQNSSICQVGKTS